LHFDDERLNLYFREELFKNSKEVNEYIVKMWNKTVGKQDLVIVAGDVSMTLDGLSMLNECNGEKWLVKGNYDININDESGKGTAKYEINDKILSRYFEKIVDELEVKIDGKIFYINHFPTNAKTNVFNICGHIHKLFLVQRNIINISADANNFIPLSEEKILFLHNAIKKFYDANVFIGEAIANVANRKGEIVVLRAPEEYEFVDSELNESIFLFLAGPASGCENWQEEFIEKIKKELKDIKTNRNIVICSPRRLEKPKDFIYEQQVDWETKYLNKSSKHGCVVFWFAKETEKIPGRSFARTSRFEAGEWFAKGQTIPGFTMIMGRENGFEGFEYIGSRLKSIDEKFKPISDKKEMIEKIVEIIKKMI